MELVSILRVLRRRWALVALGVLAALAAGLLAAGVRGRGAAAGPVPGVARAQIVVDTPKPQAVDLGASSATIAVQAALLAGSLAAPAQRAALARDAGAPLAALTVHVEGGASWRPSLLATRALEASSTPGPYALAVTASPNVPIITVVATAPSRLAALRLAGAAPAVLASVVLARAPDPDRHVLVRPVGPVQALHASSGGVRPLVGLAVGLVTLGLWCSGVVLPGFLGRAGRPRPRPSGVRP